eukprot:TRINITY_DN1635_c0_g5_i3.p1 TRINITY_DN1635_c0_g5~~TRINITY_DN1635_c0_g5_i3.p1  ORF type:complete len:195 (+),score=41.69 TRINITY_DN1635_c0_g5_i3:830-1414(+)
MDRVIKIQNLLNNWELAKPHRKYIHEDDLLLQIGPKNFKERKMYLFNDVLLVTKKKGKKFDVDFMIKLEQFKVVDIEGDREKFKIEFIEDASEILFSSTEKNSWIQLLNSAKKKLTATPDEVNHLRVEEEEGEEEKESIKNLLMNPSVNGEITKEMLINKILEWSTMKSSEVMKDIKKMAAKIMKVKDRGRNNQ